MKSNPVIENPYSIEENVKNTSVKHDIESIHIQDATIHHHQEMLNRISLQLKPGMVYGFIGHMEKRKLVMQIIDGTVKPSKGSVLLNGVMNIRDIEDWSSYVTMVEKENPFFSEESIRSHSKSGKDALINNKGNNSIFDSLLETAPILILDEAMSYLSIEAEERALSQICLRNKNTIVIFNTTRPSSLKYCDHIFLIKSKILEISKQVYFSDFSGEFSPFFENSYNDNMF